MRYYEINVSHNGRHLFATDPRSCKTHTEMLNVFMHLEKRFPKEEGFEVTVTRWETKGSKVKLEI